MRELQYTTPHGIAVTRKLSKAQFRKGLRHLLRELDSHRGVYLSSGYEFPGRYSRWDIASTCPPLELISTARKVEFRPLNERGEALIGIFEPILAAHPHWESFEHTGFRTHRHAQADAAPVLRRGAQQAAVGVLDSARTDRRIPRFRRLQARRSSAPSATTCSSSSSPSNSSFPAHGVKDLHLYFCDDIWLMDRKREQIERYQYEFEREGISTAGIPRTAAEIAPPTHARPVAHYLRPHAARNTCRWSRRCGAA